MYQQVNNVELFLDLVSDLISKTESNNMYNKEDIKNSALSAIELTPDNYKKSLITNKQPEAPPTIYCIYQYWYSDRGAKLRNILMTINEYANSNFKTEHAKHYAKNLIELMFSQPIETYTFTK